MKKQSYLRTLLYSAVDSLFSRAGQGERLMQWSLIELKSLQYILHLGVVFGVVGCQLDIKFFGVTLWATS